VRKIGSKTSEGKNKDMKTFGRSDLMKKKRKNGVLRRFGVL
jgi:hypothetical protein